MSLCPAALPQGQVVLNNRVLPSVVAPVYDVEPSDPALALHGNTSNGIPVGTQVYSGALLSGSGFTAQLFGGPTNAVPKDLRPLLPLTSFQSGASAGYIVAPANTIPVADVPEGQVAQLQLRAWDNRSGTITNWLQVLANPTVRRGQSLPFLSLPLGGLYLAPPNMAGLQSFNLATGTPQSGEWRINFQPAGFPTPPGYLADTGLPYGEREGGLTYGWQADESSNSSFASGLNSPDHRYATHLRMAASSSWRMQVTNGVYRVHLAVGNGNQLDGIYRVNVEGVLAVQGTPVPGNPWIEGDAVVAVNDGDLTIDSGPGAFNNRLCFVVITPISATRLIIGNPPLQVTFTGAPAIKYTLESSTNLSQWSFTLVFTNQAWSANIDPTAAPQRFYRTRTEVSRPALLIYSNNFESFPGSEWSQTNVDLTPIGARQFLGRFAENTVRLTLTNLPLHTKLMVEFDLFVIGSWNGNSPTNGPDLWSLNTTGGPQLLATTFHSSTTNATLRQAFPGNFPGSAFAPQTATSEVNSLGYNPDGDAVYHLSYTFAHSTNSAEINFVGDPTEPLANESWGLDNVKIYIQDDPY